MTEPQEIALAKAFMLLEKHFAHVVVVVCDAERQGDLVQPDCDVSWTGGISMAAMNIGKAAKRLDYSRTTRRPPQVRKSVMDAAMREAAGK